MRRDLSTALLTCVLGALAFLLAGTVASAGGMVLRGAIAGCVAGLAARGREDAARSALVGLAGAVAGALVAMTVLSAMGIGLDGGWPLGLAGAALAAVASGAALALLPDGARATVGPWAAFALVALVFLTTVGVAPGQGQQARAAIIRQRAAVEPVADGTAADERIHRKAHILMTRGMPFYPAWAQAFSEDGTERVRPQSMFQYREPAMFWLWLALPGPVAERIWWWFAVFSVGGMAVAYATAQRLVGPPAALLAPVGLSAYLAMPLMSVYFVFTEYWGVLLALVCLYLMVTERPAAAAVALAAAIAVRELYLYLLPVYLVWWAFSPDRRARGRIAGVAVALGLPILVLGLHWASSRGSGGTAVHLSTWLQGGPGALARALRFSGDLALGSGLLYLLVPVGAAAGAWLASRRESRALLGAAVAVPVVALTVFSAGPNAAYWGVIAVPLLLTLWPSSLARLMPAAGAEAPAVAPKGRPAQAKGPGGRAKKRR